MLIVTGIVSVAPINLPNFLADLSSLAVAARRRKGNLSYDVAAVDAAQGRVLVAERWEYPAALIAHLASSETAAFVGHWQDRMDGDIRKYDAANERGVTDD